MFNHKLASLYKKTDMVWVMTKLHQEILSLVSKAI